MAEQEQSELPSNAPQVAVLPDEVLYKSRLHDYCQKLGLLPPVYETVSNGGPKHMPHYTSTVTVDGSQYSSPNLFINRKASQRDAAKIAYTALTEKIKSEAIPIVYEDTIFCKSTLVEYGKKMKLGNPTYTSTGIPGVIPLWSSTVNFNGVSYTGDIDTNKKEAERLAARAAIISIMNSAEGSLTMQQTIKNKSKLFNSRLNLAKKSVINENDLSEAKEAEDRTAINNNENSDNDSIDADNDNCEISKVQSQPLGQPTNLPASYPERVEYQNPNPKPIQNLDTSNEALDSTGIVFVPPVADPALIPGTSESKKRSRNQRQKQNKKKKRLANQVPLDVTPLNQVPPCPVSQ